jgi:hypothetical protein
MRACLVRPMQMTLCLIDSDGLVGDISLTSTSNIHVLPPVQEDFHSNSNSLLGIEWNSQASAAVLRPEILRQVYIRIPVTDIDYGPIC